MEQFHPYTEPDRTQRITEHVTHTRCACTTVRTQCRCTTSTDTMRVERDTVHHGHHAKTSQMHDLPTRHWMYVVCVLTGQPNTRVVHLEANRARMVVWRTFPADVGHDTTTSQCACAPLHVNKQKTHATQQSQPNTTIRVSVLSKHHTASTRTAHALTPRTNDAKEQPLYSTARATWTTFDDGGVFGRRTEQEVRVMRRMYPAHNGDDLNNVETRKRATVDEGAC